MNAMNTCEMCGKPLPKNRSVFCSSECYKADRQASAPLVYTDADAPVLLPADELRRRNKELRKYGRRICRTHQGAALPLTEEYFYCVRRSTGQLDTECRACSKKRTVKNLHTRYHVDADYRAGRILAAKAYRTRRWNADPAYRQQQQAQSRVRYVRKKVRRYAQTQVQP